MRSVSPPWAIPSAKWSSAAELFLSMIPGSKGKTPFDPNIFPRQISAKKMHASAFLTYSNSREGMTMRITGIRRWCYLLTCDKPCINRKALQIRRSFEEVKKLLNPQCSGK